MSKRAPFIALYTDVLKDEALHMLADTAGYNRFEALGRISALWMWCRDRGLEDAPSDSDFYAVSEAVVRRYLGPAGVDGILGGGCNELALGVRFRDGLIQLKGTHRDVARLRELSRTRQAGGRARAGGDRDDLGRFGTPRVEEPVIDTTIVHHDSACESSSPPAGVQLHPPCSQRPDPDPEEEKERDAAEPLAFSSPPKPDKAAALAEAGVGEINRLRGTRYAADSKDTIIACRALAKNGVTPEQLVDAVRYIACPSSDSEGWLAVAHLRARVCPGTLFQAPRVRKALEDIKATTKPQVKIPARADDDFSRIPGMEVADAS